MKIKICIIGAGNMAQEYLKVLKKINRFDIVGILGRSDSNIKKILDIKKVSIFKDINEMYNKTKANAVICAVNEIYTFKILSELSKYNWKILCEKPLGINYIESKKISKIRNNKNIFLALNRRYYSSTILLKRFLKKNDSKRIIEINDQEINKNLPLNKIKISKYWMYCNSIHLIDFIYYLSRGKIVKIINNGKIKDDYVTSKIIFSSGDTILYKALWNRPGPWNISVSTKKNYYLLKPIENLTKIELNRRITSYKIDELDIKFKPGLYLLMIEFIKEIQNKKNSLVNVNYSTKIMKLINKIYNV